MARAHRIDFIGYYHVINRGVEKRVIFLDNEDFEYFLALTDELQSFYSFHLHSYCLMSNHYHLLIETTKKKGQVLGITHFKLISVTISRF